MTETIRLWRCTHCFKWSHAQRKPSSHKRTLYGGEPAEHNGYDGTPARRVAWASGYKDADVLEEVEPHWNGDPEVDESMGYVVVRCGPFEAWTATKDEVQ